MKQTVDFEDAERLFNAQIFFNSFDKMEYAWIDAGHKKHPDHDYSYPTIGVLIEWIESNTGYCITIVREIDAWSIETGFSGKLKSFQAELIDALVELCCKIQESK